VTPTNSLTTNRLISIPKGNRYKDLIPESRQMSPFLRPVSVRDDNKGIDRKSSNFNLLKLVVNNLWLRFEENNVQAILNVQGRSLGRVPKRCDPETMLPGTVARKVTNASAQRGGEEVGLILYFSLDD
jgi:hypothetical protein